MRRVTASMLRGGPAVALPFLLVLLTVLLAGAAPAPAIAAGAKVRKNPRPPPPDYYPLAVGHWWKYRSTTATGAVSEFTVKVLEKEPTEPPRYKVETRSNMPIHEVLSKEKGWVLVHTLAYPASGMHVEYGEPYRRLRNPLIAGETWRWQGRGMMGVSIDDSSRVAGAETVVVPAGEFRGAMKVESTVLQGGATVSKTYWWAPGVGMVKSATLSGGVLSSTELLDYSFKPRRDEER
jgi:hypothetical protein